MCTGCGRANKLRQAGRVLLKRDGVKRVSPWTYRQQVKEALKAKLGRKKEDG